MYKMDASNFVIDLEEPFFQDRVLEHEVGNDSYQQLLY